ncbi:MAG: hypothetical protein ACD_43C00178G0001, partial [uncultured bacterium]
VIPVAAVVYVGALLGVRGITITELKDVLRL